MSVLHDGDFTLLSIESHCVFLHAASVPGQNRLHVEATVLRLFRRRDPCRGMASADPAVTDNLCRRLVNPLREFHHS